MAKKNQSEDLQITIGDGTGKSATMGMADFNRRTQSIINRASLSNITIKSAALSAEFCNYSYEHEVSENTTNTVNIKSGVLVHNDLKASFKKLNPHLAVICEEIEAATIPNIEEIVDFNADDHKEGSLEHRISNFYVSGFKVSGNGENEGVVLNGSKRLSTGEYVQLQTPKIKWDDAYFFINELRIAIDDAISEVEEYMKGKCAPKLVQTAMDFEEDKLVEEDL